MTCSSLSDSSGSAGGWPVSAIVTRSATAVQELDCLSLLPEFE